MENLSMSLDQIIASKPKVAKKAAPKKNAGKEKAKVVKAVHKPTKPVQSNSNRKPSAAPLRQPFEEAPQRSQARPLIAQQRPTSAGILGRLGSTGSTQHSIGTIVRISNLNGDITATDVAELCGSHGETRRVEVKYSANGRSQGVAEVVFVKQASATKCVQQLHGNTLDGAPMVAKIVSNGDNVVEHAGASNNVRVGLFGSALAHRDSGSQRQQGLVQPFNNSKPVRHQPQQRERRADTNRGNHNQGQHQSRNNDRGARSGGQRNNVGNNKSAARVAAPTKTQAELDAEMDAYMTNK